MDKLKQWVALTVAGVMAVGAAGWFLLISPKRSEAADVRAKSDAQVQANGSLQTQIAMLKSQAKDLPKQQAKLAAVAAKIPDNPALPNLIRALSDIATKTDVELVSLSPGIPTAVAAAPATTAVAPSGVTSPTGARAAAVSPASAGSLQSISLTLNVVGGYFQVEQFLDGVENLTRAMKVTSFTLAPGGNPLKPNTAQAGADTGVLAAAINGTVYMATGRATAPAGTLGK